MEPQIKYEVATERTSCFRCGLTGHHDREQDCLESLIYIINKLKPRLRPIVAERCIKALRDCISYME